MKSSDSSGWRLYSSVNQQFIGSRVVQLTSGAKCAPGTPSYCCLQSSPCLTSLPAPLLPSIPTRVPCGNPSPVHRNTDTYLPVWGKQLLLLAPWTPSNICPGRGSPSLHHGSKMPHPSFPSATIWFACPCASRCSCFPAAPSVDPACCASGVSTGKPLHLFFFLSQRRQWPCGATHKPFLTYVCLFYSSVAGSDDTTTISNPK